MEFLLNDKTFKINDIPVYKQFHLLRKLAPLLDPILKAAKQDNVDEMEIVAGFASVISGLSDETADTCLYGLLGAIMMQEDKGMGWSNICASTGNQLRYQNINVIEMMQLAYKSFMHNFKDCFQFLPSTLPEIQKVKV